MQTFSNNIAHHRLTSLAISDHYCDGEDFSVISTIKSGVQKLASIWKIPTLNDGGQRKSICYLQNLNKNKSETHCYP